MITEQVIKIIKKHNLTWNQFEDFIFGRPHGINDDGTEDWYEWDVESFVNSHKK